MSDDICQKFLIRRCCSEVQHLAGDAVEVGVHRGDSADMICELLPDSTVYLFDTFTGMPKEKVVETIDYHRAGAFNDTSLEHVTKRLKDRPNARIVQGVFPQSANVEPTIRFAHVDVDLYMSTKEALDWIWPRMVDGGVLLNDDYGCSSCAGAKKAVDEFVAIHGAQCEVTHRRAILRRHL